MKLLLSLARMILRFILYTALILVLIVLPLGLFYKKLIAVMDNTFLQYLFTILYIGLAVLLVQQIGRKAVRWIDDSLERKTVRDGDEEKQQSN